MRFRTCALLLALPAVARADVTLPNGTVVPLDSSNGETQLYTLFANEGEPLDWKADAHATPDTFSPLCGFTATLVLKESGSTLGVGFYNVVPGATVAPAAAEIFEVVPPGSAVGTTLTGASIRGDPRYLGGLIGFALIRAPPHFSEAKWNTVYTLISPPAPWILSVTYKSVTMPNTYYLAFEDGNTTAFGWSNDGDYNDYVFRFSGLACAGAGEGCEVSGSLGACVPGLTECDNSGALVCKQLVQPSAEKCDGVDNDCDGADDDGADLCPQGEHCVRGTCVPVCTDEFPCFGGDVCENDVCVNPACVGVTCDAGEACIAGDCRAPCDGVVCPGAQVCRVGRCVDPCEGVACDGGRVCDGGACVLDCACAGCEAGRACGGAGVCVEAGCEAVSCAAGQVCSAGACVDACTNASCPTGEACTGGQCVAQSGGTGGGGAAGSSGAADDDAGLPLGSRDADAGGDDADAGPTLLPRRKPAPTETGCGCRLAASHERAAPPLAAPLLLLLLVLRVKATRRRAR